MHHLVAAHGVRAERLRSMRAALATATTIPPEELTASGDPVWLAVLRSDRNLIGTAALGAQRVGALGSGLVVGHDSPDDAAMAVARTSEGPGERAAAIAETIAIVVDTDGAGTLTPIVGSGSHRLYAARPADGGTVVCSSPSLLARLTGATVGVDRSYEDFLLGFGFLPDHRTVFEGISEIGPDPIPSRPDADEAAARVPSFDDAVEELHRRFLEVIEGIAGPERDTAVLLGGFDSALVAATLARLGKRVHTYTYGFGDPRYEQRGVAAITAAVGSLERWVSITPQILMERLWAFGQVFSQPGPQPHYQLHTLRGAEVIRDHGFDRVFTGDGCDAVFLGYPTVSRRAGIVDRIGRLPRPLTDAASGLAATRSADRRLGHAARMARSTLGAARLDPPARGHLPTRYLDDVALARLRASDPPEQSESVPEIRDRLAAGLGDLDRVRLAFHGNALTGQSRMKVDGSVTATGLRQYTPFTHPRIKDFISSLPVDYLRPPGAPASASGKALLLEMVRRHDLLPQGIVDLPKQSPAESPVDRWYSGPLRTDVLSLLDRLPFEWDRTFVEELLRPKVAETLYRSHVAISNNALQAVGLLASYASFSPW